MPSLVTAPSLTQEQLTNGNGIKPSAKLVSPQLSQKLKLGGVLAQSGSHFKRGKKPNTALWVTKDHNIYLEEVPYPECHPDTCIVHVRATGICGSEIHFWKTGRIGDCCVSHDLILGHESGGEILEVGANVKDFAVGDRVSIEPGVACFECKQCISGRYNLCPDVAFSGTPPTHGTMARYIAHPARFLHKIPTKMSFAQAALVEPLSVGAGAVSRANVKLGQPVLVCGAGPIGLAAALCARAAGAHPVCITDLDENRLAQAREFGFEKTVKVDLNWTRHDFAKEIRNVMGKDCHPEIAFECTGAQSSIVGSIYALVDGGVLLQVGCGKPDVELPMMAMSFREVSIITSFRYKQTWPVMIRMIADNFLGDASKFITHTFKLEDSVKAFETCVTPAERSIKVQIVDEDD
ncbi:putative xylitol dehydrogenase [Meredithblackwellia eburnea MCA 4105]